MKIFLISFFLIGLTAKINLINSVPIFGEIYIEKKIINYHLAEKYCDSLEKNLFKGLDNESTLKYEYFFSDIPDNYLEEENKFLEIADIVFSKNLLLNEGTLIIEHSKHTKLDQHPNFKYQKRYGGNVFSFFEN